MCTHDQEDQSYPLHLSLHPSREKYIFFIIEPRETHEFQVVILKTHNWIFASFLLPATVSKGRKVWEIKPFLLRQFFLG